MEVKQPKIDHNLYSRQIGAFGVEAMGKLIKLKVFIQGMRGVSPKFLFFQFFSLEEFEKNSKF